MQMLKLLLKRETYMSMAAMTFVWAMCLAALGCAHQLAATSPPSADQVRMWAGFPDGFVFESRPSVVESERSKAKWGKLKWGYHYENRKRSLVSYTVALFEPGTLWAHKRDRIVANASELSEPGVQKAYRVGLAMGPGGSVDGAFSFYRDFDLLVLESFNAEDDTPAGERMPSPVAPGHDLSVLFRKVEAFITTNSQDGATAPSHHANRD